MTTLPLYEHIQTIFKDTDFTSSNGEFLTGKIFEAIERVDRAFITILLKDSVTKSHFFDAIEEAYVLNQTKLYEFFNAKEYFDNSYTSYTNKIGLIKKESFIKKFDDVVLVFPYKDCVLEGGMSNEEASKKEVFYNTVISKDEIDRLFEPKVLTNIAKFDTNGQSTPDEISMDDNLIIKGNNLLALHCLKQRYAGKVKLIYIDPPYNTGSDSFRYNDSFSHATWLTFMKNRLEAAIKLLHEDGVMAVHCSFHEYAYLKVLMDEIFKRECELCTFNIQVRHPDRILTGDKPFNDVVEYILLYSQNKGYKFPKRVTAKIDEDYIFQIITKESPQIIQCGDKQVEVYLPEQYQEVRGEPNPSSFKTISVRGSIREKNSSGRFYVRYIEPLKEEYPPRTLFKVPNMGDDMYDFRYFHLPAEGNKNGSYYQGKPTSSDITETPYANFYNFEKEYNTVANEGEVSFRNGKKPEEMIMFLIELFTKQSEIVLDYHLGSGTTTAVAHKMNRRYIGVEQMDYIETIAIERMKKVIEGEQGGISKAIEWKGGGSFVYTQLKTIDTFNEADLIGRLNDNMRYLPLGEMEDESYGISESEKTLNKQFYGVE